MVAHRDGAVPKRLRERSAKPSFTGSNPVRASNELPAVESALLQQLRPVLALPLTSLVFGVWPTGWEWAGCALLTLGVIIPSLHGLRKNARFGSPS